MKKNRSKKHKKHIVQTPENNVRPQPTNGYYNNSFVEMNPYSIQQSGDQPPAYPQPLQPLQPLQSLQPSHPQYSQHFQQQYQNQYQDIKDPPPPYAQLNSESSQQPGETKHPKQHKQDKQPKQPKEQSLRPPDAIFIPITTTTTTTTTTPEIYLENIKTTDPPAHFRSSIPREVLLDVQLSTYSHIQQEYDAKHSGCQCCCDGFLSILGLLGLVIIAGGVVGAIYTKLVPAFMLVYFIAAGCIIVYYCTFIFSTYLCCPSANKSEDQNCLSTPYYTSIFRNRGSYDLESIEKSIQQLQSDVPVLAFDINCSHSSGSGKSRSTTVTYSATHYVPILHYRFMGESKDSFLRSVDELIQGDVSIQYCPKFIHQPDQIDYIAKFHELIYDANRHRDRNITVQTVMMSINTNPINHHSNTNTKEYPFSDSIEFVHNAKGPNDDGASPQRIVTSKVPILMRTSLGGHSDMYHTNGTNYKRPNCCLRCCLHPFSWVIGILFCCASCLLCCWHDRFSQIRYQATFHIIFPSLDAFATEYRFNSERFSSYALPPEQKSHNQQ